MTDMLHTFHVVICSRGNDLPLREIAVEARSIEDATYIAKQLTLTNEYVSSTYRD